MRPAEAKYIGTLINMFDKQEISPCINVGSGSLGHRQSADKVQEYVFDVLDGKGVSIYHVDLKQEEGVDIVGDIFNADIQKQLKALKPKLVLCCNMLEHVEKPRLLANICSGILSAQAKIIVSAPFSYPYHPDPIDTMYRPSPEEICELFPSLQVIAKDLITDISGAQTLIKYHKKSEIAFFLLKSVLLFFPLGILNTKSFYTQYHRFFWMFRPYKISCCLLEKYQ
jgi:hypothetical protein